MYMERSTHRACVVTPDAVHYGDGSMVRIRQDVHRDLVGLLNGTRGRFAQHSTILVERVPLRLFAAQSDRARAAGWQHSKVGPWTLFYRPDGDAERTVAVGVREAFGVPHLGVLVHADADPGLQAMALDRYAHVTGFTWRGTCATTALNAIRLSWANVSYPPRWNHAKVGPGRGAGPLIWSREPNVWEDGWGYVHTYDASSAYLGSAINAVVAWSTLEHSGSRPFDKSLPGYWLLRLSADAEVWQADPGRPPLVPPSLVRDGCVWVTTPMAELLVSFGCGVVDSWTATSARRAAGYRVLRRWGEQMRDARAAVQAMHGGPLTATLEKAVKRTYKDATGGMQREGMRIYRPDWAHTLIDLWRTTLLRRMIRVHQTQGVWPVAVTTDSLTYADCVARPVARHDDRRFDTLHQALNVAGCGVDGCGCVPAGGGVLGTFKHEAAYTIEQWRERQAARRRDRSAAVA